MHGAAGLARMQAVWWFPMHYSVCIATHRTASLREGRDAPKGGWRREIERDREREGERERVGEREGQREDRKSTRLNSSH